ncbi:MAG: cupin domain-containing protein [Bacteroidetes bacterium]|nr:cupin domain-containing protein [Bacteroidota bacterium]
MLSKIVVQKNPDERTLKELNVSSWPIWAKEVSEFPWEYDCDETCYILEGEVIVTPENGEPVSITAGDLVRFPKGMKCRWKILKSVRKHYSFSE